MAQIDKALSCGFYIPLSYEISESLLKQKEHLSVILHFLGLIQKYTDGAHKMWQQT